MGDQRAADHSFEVHLENHQEPESVIELVHGFAEKFNAEVLGGSRDRRGDMRYVLEVQLSSGMLFTVSNFVKEDVFIFAAYSGSDPSFSDTLEFLLKSLESAGFRIEKRSLIKDG